MATTRPSFPAATKWVSYRLPPAVALVTAFIFIARGELSAFHSRGLTRIVSILTNHTMTASLALIGFLLLCVGIWWVADVFDRPDLWRAKR
jgi:hypothetical protein